MQRAVKLMLMAIARALPPRSRAELYRTFLRCLVEVEWQVAAEHREKEAVQKAVRHPPLYMSEDSKYFFRGE